MAKIKKIPAMKLMKVAELIPYTTTISVGTGDEKVDVVVKMRLPLAERGAMVNEIVDIVLMEEDGRVDYRPYVTQFAFKYAIVSHFTDVSMPDDGEKVWEFLEVTDLARVVSETVGNDYIDTIIHEAIEAIEYKKAELAKRGALDEVLEAAAGLLGAFRDKVESLDATDLIGLAEQILPEFKGEIIKQMSGAGE